MRIFFQSQHQFAVSGPHLLQAFIPVTCLRLINFRVLLRREKRQSLTLGLFKCFGYLFIGVFSPLYIFGPQLFEEQFLGVTAALIEPERLVEIAHKVRLEEYLLRALLFG